MKNSKNWTISKQIQTKHFIVHTDKIISVPEERMYRVYPKLEIKGFVGIPFGTNLSEKQYANSVIEYFKKVFKKVFLSIKKEGE